MGTTTIIDEFKLGSCALTLKQLASGYYLIHSDHGTTHYTTIPKRVDARIAFLKITERTIEKAKE